jgi:ketosteroid isomerase-like protein
VIPADELRPQSGSRWDSVSRAWLDARDRRDLNALAALTHEHAVWESPVDGTLRGRAHVLKQVRAGFADTDAFSSQLLSFEQRGDRAVAIVRNTGRRDGEELDSRQALHFKEQDGLVALVRIVVDDPKAVAEFWTD